MADNEQQHNTMVERVIDNVGVPQWQEGIASAVNDTYSYTMNSSLFFGLLPAYMKDYAWRYIRPCLQWLDGYVFSMHSNGTSGIISTRIGNALITGLTRQVIGEKVMLRLSEENPNDLDRKNLKVAAKWVNDAEIKKACFAGIGWSLASGTSLIKENKTIDNKVWWESVRFDQCNYRTDFRGEVEDANFLIRDYTDTTQDKTSQQFFLCEHRFYDLKVEGGLVEKKEDGTYSSTPKVIKKVPMVEYVVRKVRGTLNNGGADAPSIKDTNFSVKWAEMPKWLRQAIRNDYSALKVDDPQLLGFDYIGVEVLTNGYLDLSMPRASNLGQGLLYCVVSDMITYEIAASYKLRDMYLGKGTVYQPKSLSMGDVTPGLQFRSGMANPLTNVGDKKVELLNGVDPEKQKIIVEQFEIRGSDWQGIMDDSVRNIATKWGMSPKVLSSYLLNSQTSMTATQIDSEDDISIAFIYQTRSYYKNKLNRLLESTLNFMGIPTNITLDFASPSLVNKDRIIERNIKLLDAGLITVDDAVRDIYPDLDEEQILKRIADAIGQREQMQKEQIDEMNSFGGGFGDNEEVEPTPENLEGSTEINGNR